MLSAVTVVLGIVSSCYNIGAQKDFKIIDFFYFSRQSNLLVLMVVIFVFTKVKNKIGILYRNFNRFGQYFDKRFNV
ncbi:hypothetical protein CPX_001596 [Candidatus Phytoplasma pruni]|uniref:Uncharacterized protein n=1 Tax=Candidatus Phytoplasma pruni TaxID=479893 RepID=A0A0M1MZU8_9MOLU|nr:hypothetical protein [Candidatus Phytoplasma pruni]KOR75422.1 hypothetical protein CPX_001596 [Candidatus Phytoplasma pruni]MDW3617527.1 hypothetical protein [Candidatus Phytoplasma pruni]